MGSHMGLVDVPDIEFEVNKLCLETGDPMRTGTCPVACAIRAKLGNVSPHVGQFSMSWNVVGGRARVQIGAQLRNKIRQIDAGGKLSMKPFKVQVHDGLAEVKL